MTKGLIEHHPKPGWSPEHMSALMYTCHLGVYRRALAVDIGGFQSRFDGCQDYDFVLRLMERTDRIAHIPRTLYHWRAHAMSTAGGDAKPFAYLAQPGAIAGHLERSGVDAEVQFGHVPGIHRIVHRVRRLDHRRLRADEPTIPSGLPKPPRRGRPRRTEAWSVVARRATRIARRRDRRAHLGGRRRLPHRHRSDGSRTTTAQPPWRRRPAPPRPTQLLIMASPAVGLTHDWLTRLIGYSDQPQIAAAGPVVLAPDGRIEHAGVAIPDGIPLYLQHGLQPTVAPLAVYNLSAVSGVLATRRDTYHAARRPGPAAFKSSR